MASGRKKAVDDSFGNVLNQGLGIVPVLPK